MIFSAQVTDPGYGRKSDTVKLTRSACVQRGNQSRKGANAFKKENKHMVNFLNYKLWV